MKFFTLMKDGGPKSYVHGYFLVEIKGLFSVVLLRFANGTRNAYHSHAFNALSWCLKGKLMEQPLHGMSTWYTPSLAPIRTPRTMFHRVVSLGETWVLSFRGPWADTWMEYLPETDTVLTLGHGRKVIKEEHLGGAPQCTGECQRDAVAEANLPRS